MSASDAMDHGSAPLQALDRALTNSLANGDVEMTNGSHGADAMAIAPLETPASLPSAPQATSETALSSTLADTTTSTGLIDTAPTSFLPTTAAPPSTPFPGTQSTLDPSPLNHLPPLLNQSHPLTTPARASPAPVTTTASPARASTPIPGAANTLPPSAIMPPANPHGSATRVYVNTKVTPVLLEGMKWLARNEPDKPLKWLGEYLLKRSADVEGT